MPVRAYIGLGSNLADPEAQITRAFAELDGLPASRCLARSPLYRSAPIGPQDQPDFINAVAALDTDLSPADLLTGLQALEQRHRRVRRRHWGPRTLDLDLLLYGSEIRSSTRLTLPHPRLHQRAFVLFPLYTIAPQLHVPGLGSLQHLVEVCPAQAIERLQAV